MFQFSPIMQCIRTEPHQNSNLEFNFTSRDINDPRAAAFSTIVRGIRQQNTNTGNNKYCKYGYPQILIFSRVYLLLFQFVSKYSNWANNFFFSFVFFFFLQSEIWICEIKDQHKSWLSANRATNAVMKWIQTFGRRS